MKKQRGGFIEMVLGTLCGSLSGNMLAVKEEWELEKMLFLMPLNLSTNFEIQIYYQKQCGVK